MTADSIRPIFFGVWFVLAIANFVLFFTGRDVAFKRRHYAWCQGLVGVLFLGFTTAMGFPLSLVAIMAPFVVLIAYLNVRNTRFCGACGRTTFKKFARPQSCSKCGARF